VYPNPFHSNTTIEYTIAVRSEVCLYVYDMCGRQINTLVEGQQEAGKYQVNYPGAGSFGNSLQAGVYILGLVAGEEKAQSKLIIIR
jgi:flagellar hook assembly protein FlgD